METMQREKKICPKEVNFRENFEKKRVSKKKKISSKINTLC